MFLFIQSNFHCFFFSTYSPYYIFIFCLLDLLHCYMLYFCIFVGNFTIINYLLRCSICYIVLAGWFLVCFHGNSVTSCFIVYICLYIYKVSSVILIIPIICSLVHLYILWLYFPLTLAMNHYQNYFYILFYFFLTIYFRKFFMDWFVYYVSVILENFLLHWCKYRSVSYTEPNPCLHIIEFLLL